MNKEIKEILENCEKTINEASGYNDTTDKIIDYITNLQQKNEKALSIIEKQKKKMYKSRNKIAMFILMKLENILQNGSDEE